MYILAFWTFLGKSFCHHQLLPLLRLYKDNNIALVVAFNLHLSLYNAICVYRLDANHAHE
jgi:hypothetical protein